MDMDINQARGHNSALHIQNLHPRQTPIAVNLWLYQHNFLSGDQNIPLAQMFRSVNVAIFQKFQHRKNPLSGFAFSLPERAAFCNETFMRYFTQFIFYIKFYYYNK